jgi:membrane protein implicated in regulation of membrane protease activity
MDPWQIALVLAFGLGLIELVTGGLIFLGLAAGMLVVAGLQGATGRFEVNRDVLVFALASLVAIVVMRRVFRGRGDTHGARQDDINRY